MKDNLTNGGLLVSILGMTLFDKYPMLQIAVLASGVVIILIGLLKRSKEPDQKALTTNRNKKGTLLLTGLALLACGIAIGYFLENLL